MIKPTVGRVVHYHPNGFEPRMCVLDTQPLDAHVVHVGGDRLVTLVVFDHAGVLHRRLWVQLLQDDDLKPDDRAFAAWMPYQTAVASGAVAPTLHPGQDPARVKDASRLP